MSGSWWQVGEEWSAVCTADELKISDMGMPVDEGGRRAL